MHLCGHYEACSRDHRKYRSFAFEEGMWTFPFNSVHSGRTVFEYALAPESPCEARLDDGN